MGTVTGGSGVSTRRNILYTGVYSGAPTSANLYDEIILTDVYNARMYWDGSTWRFLNGELIIYGPKYPCYVAPTGSVATAGSAVTLGTALPVIHSGGCKLYINATSGLTAGWYDAIMSSTTVGVLYGTAQSVPDNSFSSTPTTIPGNSAFTGDTNEITAWQWTFPANFLSNTMMINCDFINGRNATGSATVNNSAKIGTSTFMSNNIGTGNLQSRVISELKTISSGSQRRNSTSLSYGSINAAPSLLSEATNVSKTISLTVDTATATDWGVVQDAILRLIIS